MRNWQRAQGTIALFVKRYQNNWRITLDFKSRRQLQDNYPKWCNCHGFSVCGRTYAVFMPLSLHAMRKSGLHIVRKFYRRKHLYSLPHAPYSLNEKWSFGSCLSLSGTPSLLALITPKYAALSYSTLPLCEFQSKHRT